MSQETKLTYVTLLADPSIHPKYEAALKQIEPEFGNHVQESPAFRACLISDIYFFDSP